MDTEHVQGESTCHANEYILRKIFFHHLKQRSWKLFTQIRLSPSEPEKGRKYNDNNYNKRESQILDKSKQANEGLD